MSCDSFLKTSLELGWDAPTRDRAAELLQHIDSCPACRSAIAEHDRLRQELSQFQNDAEPPQGWPAFEQQLMQVVGASPRAGRAWVGWVVPLAMAASIFATAAISFHFGRSQSAPTLASAVPATNPGMVLTPRDVAHEVSAFGRVSEVFDGRASWMLVSNESSEVGVADGHEALARRVLVLRLTLMHGNDVASDADLLVIPGQSADLTVPLTAGNSLHYRIGASSDEPTHLTLFLELKTPHGGGAPLAALATNLRLEPGQKVTAGQLSTWAGEYELKLSFARSDLTEGKP